MTRLFGWEILQWAAARAWAGPFVGETDPSLECALSIRRKWKELRFEEPLELKIFGAQDAYSSEDIQWAADMLINVYERFFTVEEL